MPSQPQFLYKIYDYPLDTNIIDIIVKGIITHYSRKDTWPVNRIINVFGVATSSSIESSDILVSR